MPKKGLEVLNPWPWGRVGGAMSVITALSFPQVSSKYLPSLHLALPSAPWLLLGRSEPSASRAGSFTVPGTGVGRDTSGAKAAEEYLQPPPRAPAVFEAFLWLLSE